MLKLLTKCTQTCAWNQLHLYHQTSLRLCKDTAFQYLAHLCAHIWNTKFCLFYSSRIRRPQGWVIQGRSGLSAPLPLTGRILKASSRSLLSCPEGGGWGGKAAALWAEEILPVHSASSCLPRLSLCPHHCRASPSPDPTTNDPLRIPLLRIPLWLEQAWVEPGVIFCEEMLSLKFSANNWQYLPIAWLPVSPGPANTAQSCLGLEWPPGTAELCCKGANCSQVCTWFMCSGISCLSVPVESNTQYSCDGLKRERSVHPIHLLRLTIYLVSSIGQGIKRYVFSPAFNLGIQHDIIFMGFSRITSPPCTTHIWMRKKLIEALVIGKWNHICSLNYENNYSQMLFNLGSETKEHHP